MSRYQRGAILLTIFMSVADIGFASDWGADRATLKGLTSIKVLCETNPDHKSFGLTCDELQVDVELQLRKPGIIVTWAQFLLVLAGAMIGGTLIAWINGYYTARG